MSQKFTDLMCEVSALLKKLIGWDAEGEFRVPMFHSLSVTLPTTGREYMYPMRQREYYREQYQCFEPREYCSKLLISACRSLPVNRAVAIGTQTI